MPRVPTDFFFFFFFFGGSKPLPEPTLTLICHHMTLLLVGHNELNSSSDLSQLSRECASTNALIVSLTCHANLISSNDKQKHLFRGSIAKGGHLQLGETSLVCVTGDVFQGPASKKYIYLFFFYFLFFFGGGGISVLLFLCFQFFKLCQNWENQDLDQNIKLCRCFVHQHSLYSYCILDLYHVPRLFHVPCRWIWDCPQPLKKMEFPAFSKYPHCSSPRKGKCSLYEKLFCPLKGGFRGGGGAPGAPPPQKNFLLIWFFIIILYKEGSLRHRI